MSRNSSNGKRQQQKRKKIKINRGEERGVHKVNTGISPPLSHTQNQNINQQLSTLTSTTRNIHPKAAASIQTKTQKQ
jgi:hypothetical protein